MKKGSLISFYIFAYGLTWYLCVSAFTVSISGWLMIWYNNNNNIWNIKTNTFTHWKRCLKWPTLARGWLVNTCHLHLDKRGQKERKKERKRTCKTVELLLHCILTFETFFQWLCVNRKKHANKFPINTHIPTVQKYCAVVYFWTEPLYQNNPEKTQTRANVFVKWLKWLKSTLANL